MEPVSWGNMPFCIDGSFLLRNIHPAISLKTQFPEFPVYKEKDTGSVLNCLQVTLIPSSCCLTKKIEFNVIQLKTRKRKGTGSQMMCVVGVGMGVRMGLGENGSLRGKLVGHQRQLFLFLISLKPSLEMPFKKTSCDSLARMV